MQAARVTSETVAAATPPLSPPASSLAWFPLPVMRPSLSWTTRARLVGTEVALCVGSLAGAPLLVSLMSTTGVLRLTDPIETLVAVNSVLMPTICGVYLLGTRIVAKFAPTFAIPPLAHGETPPPRPSPRLRILIVTLAGVGMIAVVFTLDFLLGSTAEVHTFREDPVMIELTMDSANSHWRWLQWSVGLNSPVVEELLFRGLLFARLACIIGGVPAWLLSSALFGLLHSNDSGRLKVIPSAVAGGLFAYVYHATHSLVPSIVWHALNNTLLVQLHARDNPVAPVQKQTDAAFEKYYLGYGALVPIWSDSWREAVTLQVENESLRRSGIIQSRLKVLNNDFTQLQPHVASAVRDIFHHLDVESKGFLSVGEYAWLAQLQPLQHARFVAASHIVARRAAPTRIARMPEEERAKFLSQLTAAPLVPLIPLPHEIPVDFTRSSIDEPLALSTVVPPLHASGLMPGARLESALQQQCLRQWYSLHSRLEYRRIFHTFVHRDPATGRLALTDLPASLTGCTAAAFEAYIARRLFLDPEGTMTWLARAKQILDVGAHQQAKSHTPFLLTAHPTTRTWLQLSTPVSIVLTSGPASVGPRTG